MDLDKKIVDDIEKNRIIELDFGEHIIGDEGAKLVAKLISTNTSLKFVNFWTNEIGDEGAKAISEALSLNTSLQFVYLGGNQISDIGAKAIAEALSSNTTLQVVDLRGNHIGDEGVKAFGYLLSSNIYLQYVDLRANRNGDEAIKEIQKHLEDRTHLFVNFQHFSVSVDNSLGLYYRNRKMKGFLQKDKKWRFSLKIPCEVKLFLMINEEKGIAFVEERPPHRIETEKSEILIDNCTFSLHVLLFFLQKRSFLADLEIRADTKTFHLHRCIVAIRCPSLLENREIDISSQVFEEIVLFMYTNCIRWNLCLEMLSKIQQFANRLNFVDLERMVTHKIQNYGEDNYEYHFSHRLFSISEMMNNLYERRDEADFELEVHGKKIKIHKCIVAIQWEFFDKILLREKSHNPPEISYETFEKLIFYFYTHRINHLNETNCEEILHIADYYGLDEEFVGQVYKKLAKLQIDE